MKKSVNLSQSTTIVTERKEKKSKIVVTLKQYIKYKYLTALLLPSIAWFIVFKYIPIYGLQIAFKRFMILKGIWGSPWVGFDNFRMVFNLPGFWAAVKNTIIISSLNFIFGFPMPIILALLINEIRIPWYKRTVQSLSYLPHFISWIILAGLFKQFLSPSIGPINQLLKAIGMEPIYFLADPKWFRWVLVITNIWKGVGWGSIVYLAAISNIDPTMYEAAIIDGAGKFKQIRYITIPSLAPVITIMLILNAGNLINDNFDQIFNLINGAVYNVANVIGILTYEMGLKNLRYAEATAVGLFRNLISLGLVVTANFLAKKVNEYGIW